MISTHRNHCFSVLFILSAALVLSGCEHSEPSSTEQWGTVYRYPQLSDSDFLEKTRKGVFLIDFDAGRCSWCRKMDPHLARLSSELGDKLTIAKIDYDRNPEAKQYFGATQGIPALFVLVDGKVVRSALGYQTEEQLFALVRDFVDTKSEESKE